MHLTPFLLTFTSLLTPSLASTQQQPPSTSHNDDATTTLNKLTLRIPPSPPHLPNPHLLPATTRATLTTLGQTTLSAPLSDANTFVFRNVSGGSYLLDIHSAAYAFAPLRVDVTDKKNIVGTKGDHGVQGTDAGGEAGKKGAAVSSGLGVRAWETFRGNDWANVGERVGVVEGGDGSGSVLLEARVLGAKGYFMERSSFSVMGIFKNPVILLSMVSMAIFFGMPKMVENMDPETRAEWEERQKENPMNAIMGAASGQNSNPMGNFDMAAFLAGSGGNKGEEGSGGNNGNGNGGNGGNGKGKGEGKKRR